MLTHTLLDHALPHTDKRSPQELSDASLPTLGPRPKTLYPRPKIVNSKPYTLDSVTNLCAPLVIELYPLLLTRNEPTILPDPNGAVLTCR